MDTQMGTQFLIAGLSLLLGGCIGWFITWCFHKIQTRASKQSQEAIQTHLDQAVKQLEDKMAEGFKTLWAALNPGRSMPQEAQTNIQKASATIASAFKPFFATSVFLEDFMPAGYQSFFKGAPAGDVSPTYPDPQKSAAERQKNDKYDKPPGTQGLKIHEE